MSQAGRLAIPSSVELVCEVRNLADQHVAQRFRRMSCGVEGVEDVVVNGDAVRAIGARAAAVKMARLSSLSDFSQFAM